MKRFFAFLFLFLMIFGFSQSKVTKENSQNEKIQEIETVVLENKSDPKALEILRKADQLFYINSPRSLNSYSYKAYEKVSLDIDQDSISNFKEAFNKNIHLFNKKKRDSLSDISARQIFSKSKLFLWERAQEFKYSKNFGEKVNILDNRISGLKQPINELITLQSNRNKIPHQITQENRSLYHFFLSDTIEMDGRKTFVINFREVSYRKPIKKRKFTGTVYIDTETFGIKKIESLSKENDESKISSTWTYYNSKWFLIEERAKLEMSRMVMEEDAEQDKNSEKRTPKKIRKSFGTYAYLYAEYFDFQSPIEEHKNDFKGYTFNLKNADGETLDQYRTKPLSDREMRTYKTIDSLGKIYRIDSKAKFATGLINGQIRIKSLDFDVGELVNYNLYEGMRLGLKAKVNENFDAYVSPDYYFAYGFKDDTWKYGLGIDFKTTLEKNSFFRVEYNDDVYASGEFHRRLWNFKMRMMNYGNNINNDRYYHYKGVSVSYLNDVSNGLTLAFAARRNYEEAKFDYNFRNEGAGFHNFNTLFTLKYSPNSTNIMTPQGKSIVEQKNPELYFNFEKSFNAFGGDFNYTRFDALFIHNFKTLIGTTGFRLYGGMVFGDAPIWKNFTMNGMASNSRDLNFNLTSFLGFATLEGGKYYNDRFVAYYFTHQLPWYFKSFGQNVSSVDLVLRGTIGAMKRPQNHQFEYQQLDKLYQEVGMEWNNFLSSFFNLGLFYRVGYYTTGNFKENFALQFKLKLLQF